MYSYLPHIKGTFIYKILGSRLFWGPDDQKCFLRVLLGFVDWASEKLFWGDLTKNKILTQLSFLEFYADSES